MRDYATSPIYPFARLRSGYAFKSGDWIETGIQVVKIANVSDGQLNLTDASRVSAETAEGAKNAGLRSGDVLVGMTGYVGSVARVRPRDLPCVLNQRVGIVEVTDPGAVSLDYLYFALRSQHAKAQMESLAHGSAQPNLSPKGFGQVEIALPPLPEQRRIAAVLGALDDLIDTNQRLSANTEALLSELFADLQFDSAPTGDRATKLSSVIGVNPAIPKPSGPVPFVDMASLSTSTARISGYTERDAASSVRFTNGDALMARITPCLENGKAAYVDCLPEGKVASGSTEFIVLRARQCSAGLALLPTPQWALPRLRHPSHDGHFRSSTLSSRVSRQLPNSNAGARRPPSIRRRRESTDASTRGPSHGKQRTAQHSR